MVSRVGSAFYRGRVFFEPVVSVHVSSSSKWWQSKVDDVDDWLAQRPRDHDVFWFDVFVGDPSSVAFIQDATAWAATSISEDSSRKSACSLV